MSLSRRELRELEKTIAAITTENLRAMIGRDRAKHSREVLATAERELTTRGANLDPAPGDVEAVRHAGGAAEETEGEGRPRWHFWRSLARRLKDRPRASRRFFSG